MITEWNVSDDMANGTEWKVTDDKARPSSYNYNSLQYTVLRNRNNTLNYQKNPDIVQGTISHLPT